MSKRRVRTLVWAVLGALALGFLAYLAVGANGPDDPHLASSPPPTAATAASAVRTPVPGFGEVAFGLGSGSGGAAERCALLAETSAQLQRGLMGRTDLAGYDAMVFRFAADTEGPFFMRNVPVPLEIAWFGADGRFVSSAEMAPCADREGCSLYSPAGPYRYALEVEATGLARLGVDRRSVLTLGGACP
ncbi:MAG: DUF192 domain-containing protein [Acidimicrobiales bacterium]